MSLGIFPVAGILAILSGATLFCRLRINSDGFDAWEHIWLRIKSWWLIAALLLLCLYLGPVAITLLFVGVALVSITEFLKMGRAISTRDIGIYPQLGYVLICVMLVVCGYFFSHQLSALYGILIVAVWLTMVLTAANRANIAVVLGVFYLSLSLSFIPIITQYFPEADLANTVLFLLFITALNDVSQYIAGKTFGGKKLAPSISPNKTWSGAIGGMLTTGIICSLVLPYLLGLGATNCFFIGLILSIAGIIGDLTISLVKRRAMVTNTGSLLPGHGGILDRVDSLCLTAPAFYFLVYFERII